MASHKTSLPASKQVWQNLLCDSNTGGFELEALRKANKHKTHSKTTVKRLTLSAFN